MAGVSRQILWFVLAYTLVIIVHEGAHAVIARASGLEATMFHFWVNIDAADRATAGQRAAFGLAGPVSSLLAGLAAWIAYRSVHRSAAALPLLYLAAFGVSNFFGNMMSTAFLGDFSNVAVWLGLPMTMRYTLSAIGGVVAASTLFLTGRELARWRSPWAGRTFAVFAGIVLPVVVGTLLIILLNQPVPIPGFAAARAGESALWVFAAAGLLTAKGSESGTGHHLRVRFADVAIALVVVAVVRTMTIGISL
jgi:hypothetical protein